MVLKNKQLVGFINIFVCFMICGPTVILGQQIGNINGGGKGNASVQEITHTVFAEEAAGLYCSFCATVLQYMEQLYHSGNYDFYYVTELLHF